MSSLTEEERDSSLPSLGSSADAVDESRRGTWSKWARFGALTVQLLLLAIVIKRYSIENRAFFQLIVLAFVGFAVHYFLPLRYRLPFFLFLSFFGLILVLGGPLAAWLVGIGLALIATCHLPLPLGMRVALLVMFGSVMAAMRAEWLPAPWPIAIWPILASMFMFRLIVYLYDIEHQKGLASPIRSLSYFFLLPNVCFPLFPVVDYQAFCRTYYDDDRDQIYQVGVRWIFRGVLHLILYRILYKNWSIGIYDVADIGDLFHYCLWLFLLYLRVSGQFHIAVGILHLFGFNLTETHNLFYLSTSFTDFWRRINIYWKDFMMKLFFYPSYFRLRRHGPTTALVVSTIVVFFITWLLHAIQWFWLRGTFLLTPHDMLFWAVLALLVVINSLIELKRGRKRSLSAASWRQAAIRGLQTMATFTVICVLWSLWSSESFTAWLTLWQYAIVPPKPVGWFVILGTVFGILGGAMFIARYPRRGGWSALPFLKEATLRTALLTLLAGLSITAVNSRLGVPGEIIASARYPSLNRVDLAKMERGYYEDLLSVDRFNDELWSLYMKRPREIGRTLTDAGFATPTQDLRLFELKPSVEGKYEGFTLKTNRLGMRDKDYSESPPTDCFRIAMLGDSHSMGHGVEYENTFECILEELLNRDDSGSSNSLQILNFSVSGYRPPAQIQVLKKALRFHPKAIFYVGHDGDAGRCVNVIAVSIRQGIVPTEPYISELLQRADVSSETPEPITLRVLAPYGEEILLWLYKTIVSTCQTNGIRSVFVYMPTLEPEEDSVDVMRLAREAGFSVIDLSGVYDGYDPRSLQVAEWDNHPNAVGHRMVAERLYNILKKQRAEFLPHLPQQSSPEDHKSKDINIPATPSTGS